MLDSLARSATRLPALALAGLLMSGCAQDAADGGTATAPQEPNRSKAGAPGQQSSEIRTQLVELRQVTAPFHRIEAAQAAGYEALVTHPESGAACLQDPSEGGMGRHYLNTDLWDDEVSVTEPEVMIYEPLPGGKLQLVGVEYVIPYEFRGPEEAPPTLFGQEFLHNPTFDLWMLHVYLWKDNPEGMFATWNPRITCEHEAAVED